MKTDGSRETLGGIEGLPLQLMIIIIVATMGTAILVGWMGDIEAPKSIGDVTLTPEAVRADGNVIESIVITVTDGEGEALEGAAVFLTNMGVSENGERPFKLTDSSGTVTFTNLTIKPNGGKYGFIQVNVEKSGYTNYTNEQITVIL